MENRDLEFLSELESIAKLVTIPLKVYLERGYVHPTYVLEKLHRAKKVFRN